MSSSARRSARIGASPDVVFALINDLRAWKQWSPYEKLDPNMTHRFEGPAAGPGASFSWAGSKAHLVGKDFEQGLADLDAAARAKAPRQQAASAAVAMPMP